MEFSTEQQLKYAKRLLRELFYLATSEREDIDTTEVLRIFEDLNVVSYKGKLTGMGRALLEGTEK